MAHTNPNQLPHPADLTPAQQQDVYPDGFPWEANVEPRNHNGELAQAAGKLIEMPDYIKNQAEAPAGRDPFAEFATSDRKVPLDDKSLSPLAKARAYGSPSTVDDAGRVVPKQ